MVRISLVPALTPLYLYVSIFRSICAVPNVIIIIIIIIIITQDCSAQTISKVKEFLKFDFTISLPFSRLSLISDHVIMLI
jgi:hypothetical protein